MDASCRLNQAGPRHCLLELRASRLMFLPQNIKPSHIARGSPIAGSLYDRVECLSRIS
jgi:hypothetical protein